MRIRSIAIVIMMLMGALVPMIATSVPASDGPAKDLFSGREAIVDEGWTVEPMSGPRAAGPYGPSNIIAIHEIEDLEGYSGMGRLDDFDGDGDLDLLYSLSPDGTPPYNYSLLDLGNFSYKWENSTLDYSAVVYGFTVLDFDNDGMKDIVIRTDQKLHVIQGSTGTELWNVSMPFMLYGIDFGDVTGNQDIEIVIGEASGVNTYYTAYNFTTGAVEWDSGPKLWAGGFRLGQLDADIQEEVVYYVSDFVTPHYNITVVDAKSNTTEWNKIYGTNIWEYAVKDLDADGKDEVLVRHGPVTATVFMYEGDGTQTWTNNSFSSPAFLNRIGDTDSDDNLEIFSSDWWTQDVELIDGTTGFQQGYWTCSTYPPGNTYILPSYKDEPTNLASIGGTAGDWAFTILSGEDLTVEKQFKYTDVLPFAYVDDFDGDGDGELLLRSNNLAAIPPEGKIWVYNATSFELEWSDTDFGVSYGTTSGWVRGNTTDNGTRIPDLIEIYRPQANQNMISFIDPRDGSKVNSTQTYESVSFQPVDIDDDGLDEIIFWEGDTSSGSPKNHLRFLKADLPPTVNDTIPTVQMFEDVPFPCAINLSTVYDDDGLSGPMTFEFIPSGGTDNVTGTINGTWLDLDIEVENWNGFTNVTVAAQDGLNPGIQTEIPVQVQAVNDPPLITEIDNLDFTEDQLAVHKVTANDIENDTLTYSDNTTLFDINTTTGEINFTPLNDDVGVHEVNVSVTDEFGAKTWEPFTITVTNANDPPTIVADNVSEVNEDSDYSMQFSVNDDDVSDTVFTWVLDSNAPFLDIEASTEGDPGRIAWVNGTPTNDNVGEFYVNATVKDPAQAEASWNITVVVVNVNDEPVWDDTPENTPIDEGETFMFDVNASDVDALDVLTYSIGSEPASSITINETTGEIEMVTEDGDAGIYLITVSATDSIVPIAHQFQIEVKDIVFNKKPTSALVAPTNGIEIELLNPTFEWTVADGDGDNVTVDLYLGFNETMITDLDTSTRVAKDLADTSYTLSTPLEKGKIYYWTVIPNDGADYGTCDNGVFSFSVKETAITNHPPTILTIPKQTTKSDKKLEITVNAEDPDTGDALTFTLEDAPLGMEVSPEGLITWKPTKDQVGTYTVKVKVSDGMEAAETTFEIEVKKADEPKPQEFGLMTLLPWLILIVIIVVVMVVVAAVLMRKKGEEGPPPTPPMPQQPPAPPQMPQMQLGPGQEQIPGQEPYQPPAEEPPAAPMTPEPEPQPHPEGPPQQEGYYQPQPTEQYYQPQPTEQYYQEKPTEEY